MNYYLQIIIMLALIISFCFILFRGLFFIIDKYSQSNGKPIPSAEEVKTSLRRAIKRVKTLDKPKTK